jgi:hypothetical protein
MFRLRAQLRRHVRLRPRVLLRRLVRPQRHARLRRRALPLLLAPHLALVAAVAAPTNLLPAMAPAQATFLPLVPLAAELVMLPQ